MHSLKDALALESPPDHVANGVPKEHAALLAIWERIDSRMIGPDFEEELTRGERLLHTLFFVMTGEIENGGIHQFFSNSSGDLAEEAKIGLQEIGAKNVLAVLNNASKVFPNGRVPTDRVRRNDILTEREDEEGDALWTRFDGFDREYYRLTREELYPRLLAWVKNHADEFALPDDDSVREMNQKRPKKRSRK